VILDAAKAVRLEHEVARRGGLGLKRHGSELIGPCVRCGGTDRFAVSITKQIFLCRGCNAAGDVIALVQHIDGCDFRTAVRTLDGAEMGGQKSETPKIDHRPIEPVNQLAIDGQNTQWALKIWNDAASIAGTVAETYLRGRVLYDFPGEDVLRFHPACPFAKTRVPCLISLYRNIITDQPQAIGRTALDAAGNKTARLTLGSVKSAAVKIDEDTDVEQGLVIGEGLETCLAARQLGFRPCLSVGSAGAIRTFPILAGITSLTILVDHDEADQRGRQAGQEAALACSARWVAAGVEVIRIVPRAVGADMADLIEQEGSRRHAS